MRMTNSQSAAASPPRLGAGARSAPSAAPAPSLPTCAERFIARRDEARRYLAGRGLAPRREQGEAPTSLARWRVPGWSSLFDDSDLIALAERHGMEANHG